jgi:hypothetical protein
VRVVRSGRLSMADPAVPVGKGTVAPARGRWAVRGAASAAEDILRLPPPRPGTATRSGPARRPAREGGGPAAGGRQRGGQLGAGAGAAAVRAGGAARHRLRVRDEPGDVPGVATVPARQGSTAAPAWADPRSLGKGAVLVGDMGGVHTKTDLGGHLARHEPRAGDRPGCRAPPPAGRRCCGGWAPWSGSARSWTARWPGFTRTYPRASPRSPLAARSVQRTGTSTPQVQRPGAIRRPRWLSGSSTSPS